MAVFLNAVNHVEPTLYHRRIRELVGHGECVMGIVDSYPHPWPPLSPSSCEALERAFVRWRWRRWYPDLSEPVRADLVHLATSLAATERFDLADVPWLCGAAR
jgi:hypothetical protein